jgi:hypothetical protein
MQIVENVKGFFVSKILLNYHLWPTQSYSYMYVQNGRKRLVKKLTLKRIVETVCQKIAESLNDILPEKTRYICNVT